MGSVEGLRARSLERLADIVRLKREVEQMRAGDRPVPLPMLRRVVFSAYIDAVHSGVKPEEAAAILHPELTVTQPQVSAQLPKQSGDVGEVLGEQNPPKEDITSKTGEPAPLSPPNSQSPENDKTTMIEMISFCVMCRFDTEGDDIAVRLATNRCVCLRCFARETQTQKPIPKSLQREVEATLNAMGNT